MDQATGVEAELSRAWSEFLAPSEGTLILRPIAPDVLMDTSNLSAEQLEKLQSFKSETRKRQWAAGRLVEGALKRLLHATPAEVFSTSLSHTKSPGQGVVLGVSAKVNFPIGVDLESRTREVSARAARFFMRAEDAAFGLSPLQIWVIKEACFKSKLRNAALLVSHFEIKSFDPATGFGSCGLQKTNLSFRFQLLAAGPFFCAFSHALQGAD